MAVRYITAINLSETAVLIYLHPPPPLSLRPIALSSWKWYSNHRHWGWQGSGKRHRVLQHAVVSNKKMPLARVRRLALRPPSSVIRSGQQQQKQSTGTYCASIAVREKYVQYAVQCSCWLPWQGTEF